MATVPMHLLPTLLLSALGCAQIEGCGQAAPAGTQRVQIKGRAFELKLATTPQQTARGLMGVKRLAENEGMLFVFPDVRVRSFWMKGCLISLDLIFLDSRGRVVSIQTMPPPAPGTPEDELKHYSSRWPARFAIELAAGEAAKLGLKENDQIPLPLKDLKGLAR